ncbi:MAG: AbrB/MazE/SpoVT family DNA-binding domain-containing protein [Parcubacteria group bacterium]|nr:AbrB/MazE/SpoVT family DNA-binding domain-containing protein [Parcubacteria group bacterium]
MKIGIITKPNEKGQIVIPKKIRDALGIDKDTYLNLVVKDNSVYLYPISDVLIRDKNKKEDSYYKTLEKTKGKWTKR